MIRSGFIGSGANLGDRVGNLVQATEMLSVTGGIDVTAMSQIYETAPVGVTLAQADFLNQVIGIETVLSPMELRQACVAIESALGRDMDHGPGLPRTIDLDIISLGELVGEFETVILPHPRYSGREFVLQPLADIAPNFCDPGTGLSVSEMLENCRLQAIQFYPVEEVDV